MIKTIRVFFSVHFLFYCHSRKREEEKKPGEIKVAYTYILHIYINDEYTGINSYSLRFFLF